ncbi:hypothetical protein Bca4012_083892 [Brassica carinata]
MAGPSNTNTEFVMIDASLLDCYLCSQRLTAPIIQCTDGHYFCDSCNDGQYNKCPVCFKYISDNRCRAMERILDSAHQCPNASPNPNSRNRFSDRFRNRSIQPVPDLVYEISDDDDDSANPAGDPNAEIWFYRYPLGGRTHGPFSLAKLRNYEDYFSHVPGFSVWKMGSTSETAVPLTQLLQQMN